MRLHGLGKGCSAKKGAKVLVVLGCLLVVIALAVGLALPPAVDDALKNKLENLYCKKDSSGFTPWHKVINEDDGYINRDLILYNITNPAGLFAGGKPELTETVRYRYRASTYNIDLTFPEPGTFKKTEGERAEVDAADAPRLQSENINSMNGAYLTIVSSGGGETILSIGVSGCAAACIGGIQHAAGLAGAGDMAGASALVPAVLTACAADLTAHNITISNPVLALGGLTQLAGQCVTIGASRLAYYNCLDGGNNLAGISDYSKCAAIEAKAFAPVGSASFAKPLTVDETVSGLVITRTAGELASGYPNALQGLAQMALGYLPAFQTAMTASATAATAQEKAVADAQVARVDAGMAAVEAYTKGVCDAAAATVAAGSDSTRAYQRAMVVVRHCTYRPCTKATRTIAKGAGCFDFTPGYAVNSRLINLPEDVATSYSASGRLDRFEQGNACAGDLTRNGKMIKFMNQTSFVHWPSKANAAQDYSAKGFPTMAQMKAGKAEISTYTSDAAAATAKASGNWLISNVVGYNGKMSPPQLMDATKNGYKPAADSLQLFVSEVNLPIELVTGPKLKKALGTGGTTTGKDMPDESMQVKIKGLITNRYAVTGDSLDAVLGGSFPAGHQGLVCLAYARGFPSWLSLPNFLSSEPAAKLTEKVQITRSNGAVFTASDAQVQDDWTLQTYLDIEPVTGATINAHKRLMASFAVPQSDSAPASGGAAVFSPTGGAATDVFTPSVAAMVVTPVYYLDEHNTISDKDADTLAAAITAYASGFIVLVVLAPIGCAAILVSAILFFKRGEKNISQIRPVDSKY